MKLIDYINESVEDGKYIELPSTYLYDPKKSRGPLAWAVGKKPEKEVYARMPGRGKVKVRTLSKEQLDKELAEYNARLEQYKQKIKAEDEAYKKQTAAYKKIDEENFEILVSKVAKAISTQKNRDAFIQMKVAGIIESIKNNANKPNKDALTQDEEILQGILRTFKMSISTDEKTFVKVNSYSSDHNNYEKNVYDALVYIAKLYNVDIPGWSQFKDEHGLFLKSVRLRIDDITYNTRNKISDEKYSSLHKKETEKWEKDKAKVKKMREAFQKTKLYKDLVLIAETFEDDIETIEKSVNRAYTRYDELNGKNKAYEEARIAVAEVANKELHDYFDSTFDVGAVSCYGKSLVDILSILYLNGDKNPKIECIDKHTSGWLSGMIKSCTFKVTGEDGTEYLTGKYEDRGFDSFGRKPGDGFGPWD